MQEAETPCIRALSSLQQDAPKRGVRRPVRTPGVLLASALVHSRSHFFSCLLDDSRSVSHGSSQPIDRGRYVMTVPTPITRGCLEPRGPARGSNSRRPDAGASPASPHPNQTIAPRKPVSEAVNVRSTRGGSPIENNGSLLVGGVRCCFSQSRMRSARLFGLSTKGAARSGC
jgi:hypothetical protein